MLPSPEYACPCLTFLNLGKEPVSAKVKGWDAANCYCCSLPCMSCKLSFKGGTFTAVGAWPGLTSDADIHENKSFMVTFLNELSAFSLAT